jgi:hypothetical protein
MRRSSWLALAFALSLPSTLLADEDRATTKSDDDRASDRRIDDEDDRKPIRRVDENERVHVKNHIVPAMAGLEAADNALAAIFELAGTGNLDQKDARNAVKLAQHGLTMAIDDASSLNKMRGLSEDAQSEADRAVTTLRDARTKLQRIDNQVGRKTFSRNAVEQIRDQAKELHSDFSDAENALERVAKAYDVPTDLEFGS